MLAFAPEQLFAERVVHHLTSSTGRNELEQFLPEPIIDGHIQLGHGLQPPCDSIPKNAHSMRLG